MRNKLKIGNRKLKIPAKRAGFTLIEMTVAITLFLLVVAISAGSIISIIDANRKSRTSKTVVDNLNIVVEDMARIIKFGKNYDCALSPDPDVGDCNINNDGSGTLSVTFYDTDLTNNVRVQYKFNDIKHSIEKSYNGGDFERITSQEAIIDDLKFYVYGSNPGDDIQPYVLIVVKGHVGEDATTKTEFSLQTVASRRTLDL
ncbi:MAG: prepilin-type N-terminal cleavage/methylation domain-containing protein [Candidatus Zambryskibacteria bacterium]|nr:prepilin-type N-terminal cleavage/methylation domain-containing protein [Candidatus Zambryskibacteria bacterium]